MSQGLDQLKHVCHYLMTCIVVFCKQPRLLWLPMNSRPGGMQHDGDDGLDHYSIYHLYGRLREGEGFYLFVCILIVFPSLALLFSFGDFHHP